MKISRSCSPDIHVPRAEEPTSIPLISMFSALPIELMRPIILSESVFNLCLSSPEGFIDESIEALIVVMSVIGL